MRILIVDDSQHVHAQLKVFLNAAGYNDLLFASSGKEALDLLNVAALQSGGPDVDLILMDIEMDEMDGACHSCSTYHGGMLTRTEI